MNEAFFQRALWGNTITEWLVAAGLALAVAVALRLVAARVLGRVRTLAGKTENRIDDLVIGLLEKTKLLFILLVAVWAGSLTLTLEPGTDRFIQSILIIGLLLQAAVWGTAVIDHFLDRYREKQIEVDPSGATAVGAMSFIARVALWTVIVLMALQNLGINVTTLIAGLGVGGIAVALAVQNILGDLFASLTIVMDKPFVLGDFIIVGDYMGTVEYVGLKTTRIRSLGGEQIVFGNSDLLGARVRNYKRMNERRILFKVGVVYGTPHDKVERIPDMIREAVESQENTRFDRAHFKEYGDSALVFETVYYMLVPDYNVYMDVQEGINLQLYRRFEEEGIEFAFPTRTVFVNLEESARSLVREATP